MSKNIKPLKFGIFDCITVKTEENTYVISDCDTCIHVDDVFVEIHENGTQEDIFLTAEKSAVEWIKIRWNKAISKTAKILGDAWERSYGDLQWKGFSGSRIMPWYFLVSDSAKQQGYGVKVRPSAMCYWQADPHGITLFMDVRCGGQGVLLNGRKLKVAELVSLEDINIDSFHFAQEFCKAMCSDPILPNHPVYGSNNWYYAYGNSSEEEILSDTDYVLKLTEGSSNRPYMVIDDCWQEHHRLDEYNGGPWKSGNSKFPDMKALAEKLRQKGVHPGIWIRLLQNEDGAIPAEWRHPLNDCLDPSHPDALQYIKQDVERVCQWGYELIKHDFSTYDLFGRWGFEMNPMVTKSGWHFYDQSKTSAEIVKLLYQTIYDAVKEHSSLIIGCNTIGHLGAGLMHINRTGDDTSGLNWERTRAMGINTLAFRMPQHKTFYEVDADCVGITGNIPWALNRQWANVLAESGTPFFLSVKPGILSEQECNELHKIILKASEQKNHKIPIDWENTDCPEIWEDEHGQMEYNWYPPNGSTLESKKEKYYTGIPIA